MKYSAIVEEIRAERIATLAKMNTTPEQFDGNSKLYIKDNRKSPLFSKWSCVKTDSNLHKLEGMEIGETWDRGWGSPSITRVF